MVKSISKAIANMDKWFDTMRSKYGYGGPISHWWDSSLLFTGAMFDWRYDGIIEGYLILYEKTERNIWLNKAKRAGRDLLKAQLSNGRFRNSSFEGGAMEGGTPHEAAVDRGLLLLSEKLKQCDDNQWVHFFNAARFNIEKSILPLLWSEKLSAFLDTPWSTISVANKCATIIETLILYSRFLGSQNKILNKYIAPAADFIVRCQILEKKRASYGGVVHMGIAHTLHDHLAFSLYTARCIPALLEVFEITNSEKYLDAAVLAGDFLTRMITKIGVYQCVRTNDQIIRYPMWIAGAGDVLRSLYLLETRGYHYRMYIQNLIECILSGQDSIGGVRTALGFEYKGLCRSPPIIPEFRDVLHVCGWNDKALRALALLLPTRANIPSADTRVSRVVCRFKGKKLQFVENEDYVLLRKRNGTDYYRWIKGESTVYFEPLFFQI